MSRDTSISRKKILVSGLVQGVGFRPFVFRLAARGGLSGWVRNTSSGVEIEAEGPADALDAFVRDLRTNAPDLARVARVAAIDAEPVGYDSFRILESHATLSSEAAIPPDVCTCDECFREVDDPDAPRHLYPFTNCADCGPRFTIIRGVPYDRANTTMSTFRMCEHCGADYTDPSDRRFHAEPIACPACGPHVWLEKGGKVFDSRVFETAGKLLREGKILGVKGIGGFHLACDARNEEAIDTLRRRKGRGSKPFALMVKDLAEAERLCRLRECDKTLLLSRERPIVLANRLPDCDAPAAVAPGNDLLGLMLPYTPLHTLLLRHGPPALVMTSGNLSEEPLVYANDAARSKLTAMADALLMHDREIHVPCDDSVVRPVWDDCVIPIRRARGFVPRAIELPIEADDILGCGAEQKNTFCLAWKRTALLSQHIGDLDTAETFDYYEYAIEHFKALFRRRPVVVAHDLHPDYMSTVYALDQPGVRTVAVQHHHAHIASCLAENGRTGKCIGVALDGTGLGTDGTVWGGEILVADLAGFERIGRLSALRMPGGEAAARDPRKMACAYLYAAYGDGFERMAASLDLGLKPPELSLIRRQMETGLNSPITSSAGRLFDAVSAAIGVCRERTYEGQPAVELEMIAVEDEEGYYPSTVSTDSSPFVLDTAAVFRSAVEDKLAGVDMRTISARFHNSLVELPASACETARARTGIGLVALSGGVFQNAIILTRLRKRLERLGFEVIAHRLAPPNDGGISLGQVAVAAASVARCGNRSGE